MANGVNLFDLAAKISVDASQSDKALTDTQKKVISLAKDFEKLDKSVSSSSKSVASSVSHISDPLDRLKAEWSQKVGAMKTDLDGLSSSMKGVSGEASTTASSLAAVAGPLSLIAVGAIAAVAANVALQKSLLDLAISHAKESAEITKLATKYGVSAETIQTANILAAQSGKTLNQVLDEQQEKLDAASAQFLATGKIISNDMVAAGNQLNKELVILNAQWETLEATLAASVIPHVSNNVQHLTEVLNENRQAVDFLATSVGILAGYFSSELNKGINAAVIGLNFLQDKLAPVIALIQWLESKRSGGSQGGDGLGLLNQAGQSYNASLQPFSAWIAANRSRGGGGGGGSGRARVDAGEQLLKQLQKELTRIMPERVMWERLMGEEYVKTADAIKKKIYIIDLEIAAQKRINAATRERIATGIEEREEFQKFVALVQQSLTRRRSMRDITGLPFVDLGAGSVYGNDATTRPRSIADGATRPRIATVQEQALREQLAMHRERMQALASDLTGVLDRAIYDGFSQGAARGFATLAQGLLDIVNRIFLARLEEGLANLLSGLGGGGSSWVTRLLGFGMNIAAGSAFGGGFTKGGSVGGTLGKYAGGGFMSPYSWGVVGEKGPELVRAGPQGATVSPNVGGNVYVTVYAQDARSFMSRDTQAQIARKARMFQQKQALTG